MIHRWLAVVCNWSAPLTHEDQGREHLEILYQGSWHAAVFSSSSHGDWISSKMGNLFDKEKWIVQSGSGSGKLYRAQEMRVFTIFSRCSFHILIYYFHFNEQCTLYNIHRLCLWGESFDDYDDDDVFAGRSSEKFKTSKYFPVVYLNMISMSHMIKYMHVTTHWQIGHNNITL